MDEYIWQQVAGANITPLIYQSGASAASWGGLPMHRFDAFRDAAYYLPAIESLTVRRARPLARRRARTLRPSAVDILSRKPCLLTLFLLEG